MDNQDVKKKHHRPLSPHLSIYRPQITSVMSILHRATGIFLYFASLSLLWLLFAFASNEQATTKFLEEYHIHPFFKMFFFISIYGLYHHSFSGLRYVFWSKGVGFSSGYLKFSSIGIIILSICAATLQYLIAFNQ